MGEPCYSEEFGMWVFGGNTVLKNTSPFYGMITPSGSPQGLPEGAYNTNDFLKREFLGVPNHPTTKIFRKAAINLQTKIPPKRQPFSKEVCVYWLYTKKSCIDESTRA